MESTDDSPQDVFALARELKEAESRQEKEDILQRSQPKNVALQNKEKKSQFSFAHGWSIAFLTLILLLHCVGIYLFASGFLLTRLVLDHKSECSVPPIELYGAHTPGSADEGCWHPRSFKKAVIVIIDALRYDFTVPFIPTLDDAKPHHFHNALPLLHETVTKQPSNAFLRPFIADPPTTTLQRLKGLTTGTLPTFVDMGSNFAGTAIDEDNLIGHLVAAGRKVVHLGDDTWQNLFPGYFDAELTRPFDSFNVYDLHTVDNGVNDHILPLLHASNSSRWDVIIGHYLGVDHAGHTFGPDTPQMTGKLRQMDSDLRKIVELIDDETLLVVMGDHGMDIKGDHGGETDMEVEAALWMYSKAGTFGRSSPEFVQPPATAKDRPVAQIDLVPTLALLLGLPIPFNNLGGPIEEAFIGRSGDDFENLAKVNRLTSAQIRRYQQEYALIRKPDNAARAIPAMLWDDATQLWEKEISVAKRISSGKWREVADKFSSYQQRNLKICKALWATFNMIDMSMGIGILLAALGILAVYARGTTGNLTELNPALLLRGTLIIPFGGLLGVTVAYILPNMRLNFFHVGLFFASIASCVGIYSRFNALENFSLKSLIPNSVVGWTCAIFPVLLSAGFGSNSFTIWEDEMALLFLTAFGVIMLCMSLRLESVRDQISGTYHSIIFIVMIRLASLSRMCRDEQAPMCKQTFYASASSTTAAPWQLIIPYAIAIILPSTIIAYYNRTESYHGSIPFWIGIAFRGGLFLIAVYWTLDAADAGNWFGNAISSDMLKTVRRYVAQFVLYVAVGGGTATFARQPPAIQIETSPSSVPQSKTQQSKGTRANGTTSTADAAAADDDKPQLTVHGTGNLYGAHYGILAFTVILLPLLLLQKPMGQATIALLTIAILSLYELCALIVPPQSTLLDLTHLEPISALGPTVLALLGHFIYFKTGHQATLQSIQWDTAFIPMGTLRYPWTPLFVALNTFAGFILSAIAVPGLVMWRRPYPFAASSPSFGATVSTTLNPSSSEDPTQSTTTQKKNLQTRKESPETQTKRRQSARNALLSHISQAIATHTLTFALFNVATSILSAHLRRHLMLYRIFCPRWMLGIAALLVAEVFSLFIGYLGVGWSVGSVAGLFGW